MTALCGGLSKNQLFRVWDRALDGRTNIFEDTRILVVQHNLGHVEGGIRALNQSDLFSRFDATGV